MDANGILTLLALLLAGYTLMSDAQRMDLHLRVAWWHKLLAATWLVVTVALLFIPQFEYWVWDMRLEGPWGWDAKAALTALTLMALYGVWYLARSTALPRSNAPKFRAQSLALLGDGRLSDLAYLLTKHRKTLIALSDRSDGEDDVRTCLQYLLNSEPLTTYLAKHRPMVAIELLLADLPPMDNYNDTLLRVLLLHDDSQLAVELKNNLNLTNSMNRYHISEGNSILSALTSDIQMTIDNRILTPASNAVLGYIRQQKGRKSIEHEPYRYDPTTLEKLRSPIFRTIFFIDLITIESLYQRTRNHAWPSMLTETVKEIIEALPDEQGEPHHMPCRTPMEHHALEALYAQGRWTLVLSQQAERWKNQQPPIPDIRQHIEQLVALYFRAYCNTARHLLMCDKLHEPLKIRCFESLLWTISFLHELNHHEQAIRLARTFLRTEIRQKWDEELIERVETIRRSEHMDIGCFFRAPEYDEVMQVALQETAQKSA